VIWNNSVLRSRRRRPWLPLPRPMSDRLPRNAQTVNLQRCQLRGDEGWGQIVIQNFYVVYLRSVILLQCFSALQATTDGFSLTNLLFQRLLHVRSGSLNAWEWELLGIAETGFFTDQIPFLSPNQQWWSINTYRVHSLHLGVIIILIIVIIIIS